jgi:hypothetical protein
MALSNRSPLQLRRDLATILPVVAILTLVPWASPARADQVCMPVPGGACIDVPRPTTPGSGSYEERAPSREEIEARQRAREERRQARMRWREAVALHAEMSRVWKRALKLSSATERRRGFLHALALARERQAIRYQANMQPFIEEIETLVLWTDGVINDEAGRYTTAMLQLSRAIKNKPGLFTRENRLYLSDVDRRWRGSFIQGQVLVVPTGPSWPWLRMFYNAPEGVPERVRKGFDAVEAGDWNTARAWFQDALNRDPNNSHLRGYLQAAPETAVRNDIGDDVFGKPLPETFTLSTLKHLAPTMSQEQIEAAMDNIVLDLRAPQPANLPVTASVTCTDADGGVQTNPGACTAAARAIAAEPPPQRPPARARESSALRQLQRGASGEDSIGTMLQNADDRVRFSGPVVTAMPPGDLARYNRSARFREADQGLVRARARVAAAEGRSAALLAEQQQEIDPQKKEKILIASALADQEEQRARSAQTVVEQEREGAIREVDGTPDILPDR